MIDQGKIYPELNKFFRPKALNYKCAKILVNLFGWHLGKENSYIGINRISKQSKINNHDQAGQENQY